MDELKQLPKSSMTPASNNLGEYYQKLKIQSSAPDDGRKHRPKHVGPTRNNKFNIYGSVHRNNIPVYKSQQGAQVTEFILF
jgi:hypothetical protein